MVDLERFISSSNGWFREISLELKMDHSYMCYTYTPAGSRAPSNRSSINNITISAIIKLWRVTINLGKQITWTNIVRHFFLLNSKRPEYKKIYLSMSIQIVECSGAKTTPLGREIHKYKMGIILNWPFYIIMYDAQQTRKKIGPTVKMKVNTSQQQVAHE